MTRKVISNSPEHTMEIARDIGSRLRGGECIELISDVGGGKTTLTRGLVAGAGSEDHVSSPTFTISKVYKTMAFKIVHFDFYRLQEPGLIEHELEEVASDTDTVIIVEWSDLLAHVLPAQRLRIEIKSLSETKREIILSASEGLEYLLP